MACDLHSSDGRPSPDRKKLPLHCLTYYAAPCAVGEDPPGAGMRTKHEELHTLAQTPQQPLRRPPWKVLIKNGRYSWSEPLQNGTVYMSENDYHRDRPELGTIPDDSIAWGLAASMKGVFGTLRAAADAGAFDVSDEEYRRRWGNPTEETGTDLVDRPERLLNPAGAWVRERHPEKLLKHHILQSGHQYGFVRVDEVAPYVILHPHSEC